MLKVTELGERVAVLLPGGRPVMESGTDRGVMDADELMVSVPESGPACVGDAVRLKVQLPPASSVSQLVCGETLKVAPVAPVTEMELRVSVEEPLLVSVKLSAGDVKEEPTTVAGKVADEGVTWRALPPAGGARAIWKVEGAERSVGWKGGVGGASA